MPEFMSVFEMDVLENLYLIYLHESKENQLLLREVIIFVKQPNEGLLKLKGFFIQNLEPQVQYSYDCLDRQVRKFIEIFEKFNYEFYNQPIISKINKNAVFWPLR